MLKEQQAATGRSFHIGIVRATTALLLTCAVACKSRDGAGSDAQRSDSQPLPEVVATVGGENITREDLLTRIGAQLEQNEVRYLRARSRLITRTLDDMIRERALATEAKRQNKSPSELVSAQVLKAGLPSGAELSDWYKKNQARFQGRPLKDVQEDVIAAVLQERNLAAARALGDSLANSQDVTIGFHPYAVSLDTRGAAVMGKGRSPVTLVEFSDFQCGYCASLAPSLKRLKEKFGDDLQIVYRHFPLTKIHPDAFNAAKASLCANQEGKFWQYHDALFADQDKLDVANLRQVSKRIGLDEDEFNACFDSDRFAEQVERDMAEGKRVGVTSTPTLFINGEQVPGGAVKLEILDDMVKQALARER